jgi:hypothetical protein
MGGIYSMNGLINNAHKIVVVTPEGKRPFGKTRHRWEDNIKC